MARLLEAFGSQGIPDDMEGDALSSPFEIQNLVLELKRVLLANAWTEGEKLDARARNAALCIHFGMLLERLRTRATDRETGPEETNPGVLPDSATDDWQQLVNATTDLQRAEPRHASDAKRPRWDRPDDSKCKAFQEEQLKRTAYHSELAKLFGVTQSLQGLTVDQLAGINADGLRSTYNDQEDLLLAALREVVADYFLTHGLLPGPRFSRVVGFWHNLFVAGLSDEMARRRELNEESTGREVRELIVEESMRPELLKKIAKKVAKWRSFKGELPEPAEDEDAESEACKEILERVQRYISAEPPAANSEFLKATITGALNKILFQVREHLWYQRKRERREAKTSLAPDGIMPEFGDGGSIEMKSSDTIPSAKLPEWPLEGLTQKILVEQLLSKGIIKDQEKKVIEVVMLGGLTQAQAAMELKISQPKVSRLLKSGVKKLRNELVQNKTVTISLDKPPNN